MKYLVSACLLGENCKYNGGNNYHKALVEALQGNEVIPICPEVLGGLSIPRACAEIKNGRVINTDQEDVSAQFQSGALQALQIAKQEQIDQAIVQSRSPSCGVGRRYSGNFDGTLVSGNGVFVDLLLQHEIPVYDVEDFLENRSMGQSEHKNDTDKEKQISPL